MLMCDAALSFGPLGAFPQEEAGEAGARHERRREACRGEAAAAGAHLEPRRGACPEGEAGSRHEPLQGVFQEGEVAGAHHER